MMPPQSPRSDPGPTNHMQSNAEPGNDDRFMYKHRRKEQKKKPVFPKSGGPSILVYVKDNPRKNCYKNMYQPFGTMPPLPFLPNTAAPQPTFDNMRPQSILNPGLMMNPSLPPLAYYRPSFPPQRQRYNSTPSLGFNATPVSSMPYLPTFISPPSVVTAGKETWNRDQFTPPQYQRSNSRSVPPTTAQFTPQNVYNRFSTDTVVTNLCNPPQPTYPNVASCYPTIPNVGSRYPNFPNISSPHSPPGNGPVPNSVPPFVSSNATPPRKQPITPVQIKTEPVNAATPVPIKSAQTSPPAGSLETNRQYSHSLPGAMPPTYLNYYQPNKCSCDQCCYPMQYQGFEATSSVAEAAPANSEVSNSSTGSSETVDSGYYDNDKTFFKGEKSPVVSETGERLMVFCDQNNPTFSLDAASLQQVMGMARRENIEQYEPMFLDEKRQIRKKIPCRNLSQTGVCQFGETCWFSHQLSYD